MAAIGSGHRVRDQPAGPGTVGNTADADVNDAQNYVTDGAGDLSGTFVVPNPFTAADPAAVCPPTADQVNSGLPAMRPPDG